MCEGFAYTCRARIEQSGQVKACCRNKQLPGLESSTQQHWFVLANPTHVVGALTSVVTQGLMEALPG